MKKNDFLIPESVKDFIRKNGPTMTIQEMADHFGYDYRKAANIIYRHRLPFMRLADKRKGPWSAVNSSGNSKREGFTPDPPKNPMIRPAAVYDNIHSPYGIYSQGLNIKIR